MKDCNYETGAANIFPQNWSFITLIFYSFALYCSGDTDKLHMDLIWLQRENQKEQICKEILNEGEIIVCIIWKCGITFDDFDKQLCDHYLWKGGVLGCGVPVTELHPEDSVTHRSCRGQLGRSHPCSFTAC